MRPRLPTGSRSLLLSAALLAFAAHAAWQPTPSRELKPGEIAVTAPGNCDKAGATYVLTQDVTALASALFLGNNVTLDLNGHTLTYAAGYSGVPNCSFEDGLQGWDVSKAPGAEAKEMPMQHPLVGRKVCLLPKGQEIVSPYVQLPLANRAYYAMTAVASHETHVGVFVEDDQGRSIECAYRFGNNTRPCCPEPQRASKLGGGVVFALLFGQPAGKYRVRVKAVNAACVIDEVDLRPAMDVGIGIVEKTLPWAYYKCILDGDGCAFFDQTKPGAPGEPVDSIPHVSGQGVIKIRNGIVRLGSKAIRTWGLQSTAAGVRLEVENVKFVAAGINTNAVYVPSATMRNCRVETDTPWIIDRHRQEDYAVSLMGTAASDISGCEFIGGQGQLTVRGDNSRITDNLLVNRQTVVNHYSLGVGGQGTQVSRNRILPEQGSGILIGRQQGLEIFENEIRVEASPPVNEYHASDYSVNAIRLTDYNASKTDPKGYCGNNRIHHNKITVTGRKFPGADPGYKPMTYAVFMSVGGDQNYIHDNEITVDQKDAPNSEAHGAYAFYIGGSDHGGVYTNNVVASNVTPVWISNMYGPGSNVILQGNTFRKPATAAPYTPFTLGWYKNPAKNVGFYSNRFEGLEFGVTISDYTSGFTSAYEFGWTLTVKTAPNAEVIILDKDGRETLRQKADDKGVLTARLAQYRAAGQGQVVENGKRTVKIARTDVSQYTVKANGKEKPVTMTADANVEL
jgi:hypothetical protein